MARLQRYLNNRQRNHILMIAMLGMVADNVLNSLKPEMFSSLDKRRLKTIITYSKNTFESFVNNVIPQRQLKSMHNCLRSTELELVPKVAAKRAIGVDEAKDNMFTVVAYAMESTCCKCKQGKQVVDDCKLREIFMDICIPYAKDVCTDDECPFSVHNYGDDLDK